MEDNIIDSVIAGAQPSTAPETQLSKSTPDESGEVSGQENAEKPDQDQDLDVPFPKKAVRAISRRDKKIEKLQAELAAYRAGQGNIAKANVQQPQATQPKNQNNDQAPREEDFENYGDFVTARAEYNVLKKLKEQQEAGAKAMEAQQYQSKMQEYIETRDEEIAEVAKTYISQIPDYQSVISEASDIVDTIPWEIQQLFYEADDAALAVYNLAKEGKLERLATMSPYKAAIEIDRAQQKKPQLKKVPSAPEPIKGMTGASSSGSKTLDRMSGEEIIKHLKIR